jgi:hypothetical protein
MALFAKILGILNLKFKVFFSDLYTSEGFPYFHGLLNLVDQKVSDGSNYIFFIMSLIKRSFPHKDNLG